MLRLNQIVGFGGGGAEIQITYIAATGGTTTTYTNLLRLAILLSPLEMAPT